MVNGIIFEWIVRILRRLRSSFSLWVYGYVQLSKHLTDVCQFRENRCQGKMSRPAVPCFSTVFPSKLDKLSAKNSVKF